MKEVAMELEGIRNKRKEIKDDNLRNVSARGSKLLMVEVKVLYYIYEL